MKSKSYVGCAGFAESYWKGIFYPEDLPTADYLKFYSQHLPAVEINSTFYRKPRASTLEKWKTQSAPDFKFFIKIPKAISHLKKLQDTRAETSLFCDYIFSVLDHKLGGFLFQLPPSFKYTEENLVKVLETVDSRYLNVVEFRHSSWWTAEIQSILKEKNIVFAGVSIPRDIPDEFVVNNDCFSYYRLHGVPQLFKSEYSPEFLQNLANKVTSFKGISYIFFNNTFGTAAIKNAVYLKEIVENPIVPD